MPLVRPVIVQTKLSVEGGRNDWLQDRKVSSMNGRAKGDKIRVSSVQQLWRLQSSGGKQAPLQSISGRVASSPDARGMSAQNGVFFENLSNAPVTLTANGRRGA